MPLHALNYARFGLDKLDFAPFGIGLFKGDRAHNFLANTDYYDDYVFF